MIPDLSILLTRLVEIEGEIATLEYGDFTSEDKLLHDKLVKESDVVWSKLHIYYPKEVRAMACRGWEGQAGS